VDDASSPLVVGAVTGGAALAASVVAFPLGWAASQSCPTCFANSEAGLALELALFIVGPPALTALIVDSAFDARAGFMGPFASVAGVVVGYVVGAVAGVLV